MDIGAPPSLEESVPQAGSSHLHGLGQHSGLTHAGHTHLLELPPLSASFPLPFRVLSLVGLAILLWGTNLHILHLLGINVPKVLDFREPQEEEEEEEEEGDGDVFTEKQVQETGGGGGVGYMTVYKLAGVYTAFVGSGWVLFRLITGGEVESMEDWRGLVGVVLLGVLGGALVPWRGIGERERRGFRRALKRIIIPTRLDSPVFFCDVILADILTSFAKVLGDLWLSASQIWFGGITHGRVSQNGWSRWITLGMVCLPYALRFRQCLTEYHQSSYTSPRPLANSLKYFSAFPVILLSAAQKQVFSDLALEKGITVQELRETHERWFGEHRLFRLWLLAVVVNSMFSFWWDVEMDWGLRLCEIDTWIKPGRGDDSTPRFRDDDGIWKRALGCLKRDRGIGHQRSPCPTPGPHISSHSHSHSHSHSRSRSLSQALSPTRSKSIFNHGLRQIQLLPDPIVYHIFTLIDLILRFTWSLKLSSHLHTIAEIESGVFMMEALELIRRWMWVFVRVEWEAVKQVEVRGFTETRGLGVGLVDRVGGVSQVVWEGDREEEKEGV